MQTRTLDQRVAVPQREIIHIRANVDKAPPKLRVAGYARVSSDSSDQLNSFTAQINHYTKIIEEKQNWQLVNIYADEGISGTSTEKRDDFNRMLSDCRKGKIDRIITKSLSRFSRNTVDSIRVTRELKQLGISICFEKDGIDTAVLTSENLLTLYALFAQQESQSISQNCKKGARMRMSKGEYVASNAAYGYRLVGNELHVYEPEATVVRRIFAEYLSGKGTHQITRELNREGVLRKDGKCGWQPRTVAALMKNERYVGDMLLQKTFKEDDLPYTQKKNSGELPQFYVKHTHEAIVDREQYELVNILLNERNYNKSEDGEVPIFLGRIRCKVCGARYRRKLTGEKTYWVCRSHDNRKDDCSARRILEHDIETAFIRMYNKLQKHCGEILVPMHCQLEELERHNQQNNTGFASLHKKIAELTEQSHVLSGLMSQGILDSALFISQTDALNRKIRKLKQEKAQLMADYRQDDSISATQELISTMENEPEILVDFQEAAFTFMVEQVLAFDNKSIDFVLKNGLTLTERL